MNKIITRIIIAILIIMACFIIFITVDCVRLRNSKMGTKPLITTNEIIGYKRVTYYGIGYYVQYYLNESDTENINQNIIETKGYGAEFRLLNKILIWAWVI